MLFQNDLGYVIDVQEGYISSASVQLVPCDPITSGWWTVPTAYAGHGDSEVDPSRWVGPIIESFTDRPLTCPSPLI